jgi:(2Fe-2S) ferredoxin/ubiquinone/menaquinone biosynthesis C-methylase UbiE
MEPFRHHVFICTQQRLEDKPYCAEGGAEAVLNELQRLVHVHRLDEQVQVTPCGCLGLCHEGPNLVVYPEGIWYSGVKPDQVNEIVHSHFLQQKPVERLAHHDPERMRSAILTETARTRREEVARQEAGVLPDGLRRLADDFRASRAFLTAVELDVFSAIGDGGDTITAIAEHMGADARAAEMLLNALTSLGLLVKEDGRFHTTVDTGRYLRRGLPDDARAALMHRVNMWDRWSTLTECVREGSAMGFDTNAGPLSTQAYIAATHKIAMLAAPALVSSLDLSSVTRVLDVGGGSGAYSVAVLKAFPAATAELLDLAPVTRISSRYIRDAGMEDRIRLRAGDFTMDPLGSGFDLVLLSYIMHLNPAETSKRLLAKTFDALVPGGRVVINDYILNRSKTLPRSATLQALQMLVSTRGGGVHSDSEYRELLEDAGFTGVRKVELMGPTDVITGQKP